MKEHFSHPGSPEKDILFSRAIKAGKRIYYIDVKQNSRNEMYLSLTESKKIVSGDAEMPQFSYEKHKIFLYKEDFEKVSKGLADAIKYIETGEYPADYYDQPEPRHFEHTEGESHSEIDSAIDKWFDSLDK